MYNKEEINKCIENLKKELNLSIPIQFDCFTDNIKDLLILYKQKELTQDFEIIKSQHIYTIKLKKENHHQERYQLAKALAYIFLGYVDNYPNLVRRFANELEYSTDYFALKLLIPTNDLITCAQNEIINVENLSKLCDVSIDCVRRRINQYNNGD